MRRYAKSQFLPLLSSPAIALAGCLSVLLLAGCQEDDADGVSSADVLQYVASGHGRPRALDTPLATTPGDDAPVAKVEVATLWAEMNEGREAVAKYEGSWIEVTGKVESIATAIWDLDGVYVPIILLKEPDADITHELLGCLMASGELPWENSTIGATITVRGVLTMTTVGARFVECRITEGTGPVPMLSVDEMVESFQADPAAFVEEYQDKQAIVYGTYVGNVPDPEYESEPDDVWVTIEGEGGERLYNFVMTPDKFTVIEPGETVYLLGEFLYIGENDRPTELLKMAESIGEFMGQEPE